MKGLIEIFQGLLSGLDFRGKWIALILSIFLVLLSLFTFELITDFNYFRRLERKTILLKELNEMASTGIRENSELEQVYLETIEELSKVQVTPWRLVQPSIVFPNPVSIGKAISGSSIWLIMLVLAVFGVFGNGGTRIVAIVFMGVAATIFGYIGSLIPTMLSPWINYFGFPILQSGILIFFSNRASKLKKK